MKHKFNFLAMALLSLLFTITSCEKDPGTDPIASNPLVVTDVDGNNYNVIVLNNQMWLKENLRTTKLTNGVAISEVKIASDWMGSSTPAYCKYENRDLNKANHGLLYNAYAIKTGKLCPAGWHVPSEAEWNKLVTYLGGTEVADNKLRSTTGWTGDVSATDSSRLTILPGGYRDAGGEFQFINEVARFWTSTAFGSIANAVISIDTSHVENINNHYVSGNSVRCIKD